MHALKRLFKRTLTLGKSNLNVWIHSKLSPSPLVKWQPEIFSLCVLQEICLLQHSADSVQESMGPSDDVQKHDAVIVFKILPRCVTTLQSPTVSLDIVSVVWPLFSIQMTGSRFWWMWKEKIRNRFHSMSRRSWGNQSKTYKFLYSTTLAPWGTWHSCRGIWTI